MGRQASKGYTEAEKGSQSYRSAGNYQISYKVSLSRYDDTFYLFGMLQFIREFQKTFFS